MDLMLISSVHHMDLVIIDDEEGIDIQVSQCVFWADRLAFEKTMSKFRYLLKLEETLFDKFYFFDGKPEKAVREHREYFNYMVHRYSEFCKKMFYYWRVRFADYVLDDVSGRSHRCMFENIGTHVHDLRYQIGHPFPIFILLQLMLLGYRLKVMD